MNKRPSEIIFNDGPHIFVSDTTYQVVHFLDENSIIETTTKTILSDVFEERYGQPILDTTSSFKTLGAIVAIGDVPEFDGLKKLLRKIGVIDQDMKWIFGNGHIVFCGDVFGRGEMVTDSLWLILEQEAAAAGGKVHFILGNHEIMLLTGDLRYLHKKYRTIQQRTGTTYTQLMAKGSVLGDWLRTKKSSLQINNTFICSWWFK